MLRKQVNDKDVYFLPDELWVIFNHFIFQNDRDNPTTIFQRIMIFSLVSQTFKHLFPFRNRLEQKPSQFKNMLLLDITELKEIFSILFFNQEEEFKYYVERNNSKLFERHITWPGKFSLSILRGKKEGGFIDGLLNYNLLELCTYFDFPAGINFIFQSADWIKMKKIDKSEILINCFSLAAQYSCIEVFNGLVEEIKKIHTENELNELIGEMFRVALERNQPHFIYFLFKNWLEVIKKEHPGSWFILYIKKTFLSAVAKDHIELLTYLLEEYKSYLTDDFLVKAFYNCLDCYREWNKKEKTVECFIDFIDKEKFNNDDLLCWSIFCGWENLVQKALENGANVNLSSKNLFDEMKKNGLQCLHSGLWWGIGDSEEPSPLLIAVNNLNMNIPIIEKLLQYSAKVNVSDRFKNTPLHYAARVDNEEVVKVLLENGADPALKNSSNQTPREITQSKAIKELLPLPKLEPSLQKKKKEKNIFNFFDFNKKKKDKDKDKYKKYKKKYV